MTKDCTCPDLLNGHHSNCFYLKLEKIESEGCHCDCCDPDNSENMIQFPNPKDPNFISNINVFLPAHLVARLYLNSNPTARRAYSHTSVNYVIVSGRSSRFGFEIYSDQSTLPCTPCYVFSETFIKWFQARAIGHGWDATFLIDYDQLEKDQGNNIASGNLPPRQRFAREKEVPEYFHAGVSLKSRSDQV